MEKYTLPHNWIRYDFTAILAELVEAKSAINALMAIPYQKAWVENLQKIQLKREIAGTSQIEGADFTERELDEAMRESPEQLITRSQKQAHAAVQTYRWLATVPDDQPVDSLLIRGIHTRIVTGADDDHCEPGKLRTAGQNVIFGQPRHRGVEGGKECTAAFNRFAKALEREYRDHDPIIRALAAHYHIAAIHPFLDGNGRTARALEALFLQRAGLRDTCFIALSNYYYHEKAAYLQALNETGSLEHDLTPFLKFGLKGIASQAKRLMNEIGTHLKKAVFRNVMYDLFGRLESTRKRVLAARQINMLKLLLEHVEMKPIDVFQRLFMYYQPLKNPGTAFVRDISGLLNLHAIIDREDLEGNMNISVNLDWPKEITESDFMQRIKKLPKARTIKIIQ